MPLVSLPAEAAPPVLRDTVCPGKPISLNRLGQQYTLLIDRASLSQNAAVLKLLAPEPPGRILHALQLGRADDRHGRHRAALQAVGRQG